ncbi:2-(3-amino-3-carboxypropyl)histidine synthase, partial [Ascoidea rubescens DSM 1968]
PVLSTQSDSNFQYFKYSSNNKDHSAHYVLDDIKDYYSLDDLLRFLNSPKGIVYKKISLQFPDTLINQSSIVLQYLQDNLQSVIVAESSENELNFTSQDNHKDSSSHSHSHDLDNFTPSAREVWILADTSYSPCCIDEIAAQHVNSDLIVHFGDSCLSNFSNLTSSSILIFGKPLLNYDSLVELFKEKYPNKEDRILLISDTVYNCHLFNLYRLLKNEYTNLAYSDLYLNNNNKIRIIGYELKSYENSTSSSIILDNRVILGLSESEIKRLKEYGGDDEEISFGDYKLFHISQPDPPRLLYLSTKFDSLTIYNPLDGSVNDGPYPSLKRRYRSMFVARNASTIGILINTLSLSNTLSMLNMVKEWIHKNEKKSYMFVVGKPNVSKLANFDAVDCWVALGCSQNGMIIDEYNEYYKPILTPYELYLALAAEVTWTGKWVTDFKEIMKLDNRDEEDKSLDGSHGSDEDEDEDAPEFNPVTGQYAINSRPLRPKLYQHIEIEAPIDNEKQLVKQFSKSMVIKGTISTSALYLQSREWSGLGSDFVQDDKEDDEGAILEQGRSGIARGYGYDRKVN